MSAAERQELIELERTILLHRGRSAMRLLEVVDQVVEVAAGEAQAGVKEPGRMKELALAMKYLADAVDRLARLNPSPPPSPSRRTPPPSPPRPTSRPTELGELILYGDRLASSPHQGEREDRPEHKSDKTTAPTDPPTSPTGRNEAEVDGEALEEDEPAELFDTIDRLPATWELGKIPDLAAIALNRLRREEATEDNFCPFANPCPLGVRCSCHQGEFAPRFSLLEQSEEEEELEEGGRERGPPHRD